MVKKSVLEKLSDKELERFIEPESRKTPEAIQLAYEILVERKKVFSVDEHNRIQEMFTAKIKEEKELELSERKQFDKQITDDESAIALYTNLSVFFISFLFGILYGFILAMLNFFILKKYWLGILLLIIGSAAFLVSGILIAQFFPYAINIYSFHKWIISAFMAALGLTIIHLFNKKFFPKDLKYRSRPLTIPIVLIVLFYLISFLISGDF